MKIKWGRLYKPDRRDKKFLMKPDLRLASQIPYKYWWVGQPLNQGSTPQCVGYSGYKYLTSFPVVNLPKFKPFDLYKRAKENDEWEGEDYDGSSVRGLFKWLNKAGYVSKYEWTFDVNILAAHILTVGPVVVGTDWLSGMEKPDSNGILSVQGHVLGGHAYLLFGCNQQKRMLRMINSWGNWGQNGRAWISYDDFQVLLNSQGEACVATEVKVK